MEVAVTGHWLLYLFWDGFIVCGIVAIFVYCSALGLFTYTPPEDPWTKR